MITLQYTVSQSGLQNVTHSDTQTISAQGNVLIPVQPSGRHYVSTNRYASTFRSYL